MFSASIGIIQANIVSLMKHICPARSVLLKEYTLMVPQGIALRIMNLLEDVNHKLPDASLPE
jgi:hypothetical protein